MKAKHALVLYALGLFGDGIGTLFIIEHWVGGREISLVASIIKLSGVLLLLAKLLAHPRVKQFLNS